MFKYKLITEEHNLSGKKVILRLDLNVPVKKKIEGHVRLSTSLEMINYLRIQGAKIVIIAHMGREPEESLRPLVEYFSKYFPVKFEDDVYSLSLKGYIDRMKNGEVLMIENIRKWEGEVNNDEKFGKHLASLGDIYVNEAFAVSHRAHASVVGVPKYLPSYAGMHFHKEVKNISRAFDPLRPFVAIIGGAKFETKIPLIKKLFRQADKLIVVGALANDIYKYRGYKMGSSKVSDVPPKDIGDISDSEKVVVPGKVLVSSGDSILNKKVEKVKDYEKIVDAGRGTTRSLKKIIKDSKMVVWNGPFGMYEQGYVGETKKFAKLLAKSKAVTIVGGGDTLASLRECDIEDEFTFVSTAGGAMLEFLEKETLVGIEALGYNG